MASSTVKYATTIIASLIAGALIGASAWQPLQSVLPGLLGKSTAPDSSASSGRKVLYWYDPMKPDVKFDKPGKSPFMDMELVPKFADETGSNTNEEGVRINPTIVQNLGLKTELVTTAPLHYQQSIPANVNYNEYQYSVVQARSSGFVEKVYPHTVGDHVKKGEPLIDITIPQWVETQSEYLILLNTGGSATQIKGVLERLRLAGMPDADIERLKRTQTIQTRFTIRAPIEGVITGFDLRQGMNITPTNVIAKIQGIDPVWVSAAVPESIAYLLKGKTELSLSVSAYPQEEFPVTDWQLLPSLDTGTRTLQIRMHVNNPDERLKPGMTAYLNVDAQSEPMLQIPSQAIIDSGKEQRVIVMDAPGHFVPKPVKVLHEVGGRAAISDDDLFEGEEVVVSGLFLIDSEANIAGALERMRQSSTAVPSTSTPEGASEQSSTAPSSDDHVAHAHH